MTLALGSCGPLLPHCAISHHVKSFQHHFVKLLDTTAAPLLPTRSPRSTTVSTDTTPDTTRDTDSTTEDTDTTDSDSTTADTESTTVDTDTPDADTPPRRPAEATALSTPTSMVWTRP